MSDDRWLLPGGMDEMLPEQAYHREQLRRRVYDAHLTWGYRPVHPPFVEYLESLLTAAGQDFDQHTFRIADPLSGRMLGVRADMTPQVARIDAHQMGDSGINRLFYMGTVIRAYGGGPEGNRSPFQLGAELFGHRGDASDIEIIQLMLRTLELADIVDVTLDLGHVGIFRSLCTELGLEAMDERRLFELLQAKAETDIGQLVAALGIASSDQQLLLALCSLHGDRTVLERSKPLFANRHSGLMQSLLELEAVGTAIESVLGSHRVHYDLAELRGYQYHNGVVFAAYVENAGSEIARGGRYDGVGAGFGRARPATGYSTDLKVLMRLSGQTESAATANLSALEGCILAPDQKNEALREKINQLRSEGYRVIVDIDDSGAHEHCNRQLQRQSSGQWTVETLSGE